MAEKKTRKKASKKIEIQSTQDFIDGVTNTNEIQMPEVEPAISDKVAVTPAVEEVKITKAAAKATTYKFRFVSTISKLNISNIIFDNINVIIYECEATDAVSATTEFIDRIYKRFNNSQEDYIKFINGVFGSRNNVILERIDVNNITQEIITL